MLDLLLNAQLQALTFGVAVLGVSLAFRILRYPDLTADGAFMLGSATFAATTASIGNWGLALAAAAGAAAGALTSLLNVRFGVGRLFSGILTTMMAYSLAYRCLGGNPTVALPEQSSFFDFASVNLVDMAPYAPFASVAVAALVAAAIVLVVWQLLRSELGLLLRTTGNNPALISELGRSPAVFQTIGLATANGLIGLSAALVGVQQHFVDINLGAGVVISLVASLVLGEEIFSRLGGRRPNNLLLRVLGPFVGAMAYFLLYLLALRASIQGWIPFMIQPTDLKLLSAVLVVSVIVLRAGQDRREDILPL